MTCHLYRHYDAAGVLLYVGVSRNAAARLEGHAAVQWFARLARVDVASYPTRQEALAAEGHAITIEEPLFNKWRPAVVEPKPKPVSKLAAIRNERPLFNIAKGQARVSPAPGVCPRCDRFRLAEAERQRRSRAKRAAEDRA